MKTQSLSSLVLTLTAVAAVTFLAANAVAQESSTSTPAMATTPTAAQPAAASQAAPQLSYGVAEIVQLAHANVGEDVIVNYVQNSGNAYGLDANQILYLKQQGVSDHVINAMLKQRSRLPAAPQTAPPPNYSDANSAQTATAAAQPSVSYVQTAPPQTVYVIPDTQTYNYYAYSYPYYYPYYGYYGWPDAAPFDAIMVTAAPDHVPAPLLEQLALNGRMILPVGRFYQDLIRIRRTSGGLKKETLLPVRFVPMTGESERGRPPQKQ